MVLHLSHSIGLFNLTRALQKTAATTTPALGSERNRLSNDQKVDECFLNTEWTRITFASSGVIVEDERNVTAAECLLRRDLCFVLCKTSSVAVAVTREATRDHQDQFVLLIPAACLILSGYQTKSSVLNLNSICHRSSVTYQCRVTGPGPLV